VIRAVAVAAALAMGATTAAAAPSPWQRATTSADAAQAARAYDEAMLEGDDRVAQAANTVVYEQRKRLVRAALDAYDRAALARPDLAEPRWRAATVVNAFLLECEQDRAPLCGREPRASDAERAIAYWDAAERLAPLDPRFTDRVMFARAILHTKLATPTHLRAAARDYQALLDRMRGTVSVDPLTSNLGERSLIMGNLAETFMMLGDLDRAIETYREAQRLSPELTRAFGLAVALDRDEQGAAAFEVLRGQGPGAVAQFIDQVERGGVFFVPEGEVAYYLGLGAAYEGEDVAAIEHFQAFIASGAHPAYQPRARAHLAELRARLARRVRGR
jgi:tetratricopeptide (TPR) repeat protein